MFEIPPLANQHPAVKLIAFAGIAIASIAVFSALGILLAKPLFGVDLLNNPLVLMYLDRPEYVSALKLMQLLNALGLFIVPPAIFVFLVAKRYARYFYLNKAPSNLSWFLVPMLIITALPVINWMAEINSDLDLPAVFESLERWMQRSEDQAKQLTEAFLQMDSIGGFAINIFLIALLPAIGEELFFRGVIQKLLIRWSRNSHIGIWLAAIVFSALHGQFYGFLPRMVLGAMLGYLLVWSSSLWLPILAHFVNNGAAVALSYFTQRKVISEDIENIGSDGGIGIFVASSILISGFLLFVIYREEKRQKDPEVTS